MVTKTPMSPATKESTLVLKKAVTDDEVRAVHKLRFEVFNLELEEGLASSYETGLDIDEYDKYCDHIIVLDSAKNQVVGTYRLLPSHRAEEGIGFYSDREFDLSRFKSNNGNKLELGRACVHKDYRGSTVLNLMWSGIAKCIEEYDAQYVFGCGSIHTINPKILNNIYAYFKGRYRADERFRVTPLQGVPGFDPNSDFEKDALLEHIPPLLLAYFRLGARICGEPAFDEEFGVADFLVLLDRKKLLGRYKNRYF